MNFKFLSFCLITISVCVSHAAFSANYFLSNSGNDANSGTTASEPWQSINHLNTIIFLPGDSIFFLSGNIFRGQINILSGGDVTASIYFGTYGGTDPAIISGAQQVTGWNIYSGNIYQAPWAEAPAHLFIDNNQMTIARYPNHGYLKHQEGISNIGFVDSALNQPDGYWNGAMVRMRTSDRRWEFIAADSFSSGSIFFDGFSGNLIPNGYGYYFDNLLSLVDTAKEWCFDSLTQSIYFITPLNDNPGVHLTEVSVNDYGMLLQNGSSYITIDNLIMEKQRRTGIMTEGSAKYIGVHNCILRMQGENGFYDMDSCISCSFSQNRFNDINGIGLSLRNAKSTEVANNEFKRIGLVPGYGYAGVNNQIAVDCNSSDSLTVSQNIIDSVGSCGIFIGSANSLISKNLVENTLMNVNDLGGLFLYGNTEKKCIIQNNIIIRPVGDTSATTSLNSTIANGIYADANSVDNILQSNTVAFATTGILLAGGCNGNLVDKNLVYGCTSSQMELTEGIFDGSTFNNTVTGNTFYALHEDADVVRMTSLFTTFNPAFFDSNYYFNPYNFFAFRTILQPGGSEFPHYYTLQQWNLKTQMDSKSQSTYFFWNRYSTQDTLSDELITNGMFTNNFDGWSNELPDSITMLLDNGTPLDNGCLKLVMNVSDQASYGNIASSDFPADSGQFYTLSLSTYSEKAANITLKPKEDFGNYIGISSPRSFPFFPFRQNYQTICQVNLSSDFCRLDLQLYGSDSIGWLDNLSIRKVSVNYNEPTKKSRLFVNASDSPSDFNLEDSIFFDLNQNIVNQQISLPPYSSCILIFDSSFILSNNDANVTNQLTVYPNPAHPGRTVNICLSEKNDSKSTVEIYDLESRLADKKQIYLSKGCLRYDIPGYLHPGYYILRITVENNNYTASLVIIQ